MSSIETDTNKSNHHTTSMDTYSSETDKNISNQHATTMDSSSSGCESKVKCRTATEEVTDINLNCSVTVTKERTLDEDTDPNCNVTTTEGSTLDEEVMDTGLYCSVTAKDMADGEEELDSESNARNVLVIVEEGDDEHSEKVEADNVNV